MNGFNNFEENKVYINTDLTTKEECKNDLTTNYNTPGHPIAFSGIINIYRFYRNILTISEIKEILSGIENYTLHREYRSAQRNPTYSHFKRYCFQMDLVDMQQKSQYNDGVKYLLTVIDTFTRFAFVRMLKDKTAETVLKAFKHILEEAGDKPVIIVMDRG